MLANGSPPDPFHDRSNDRDSRVRVFRSRPRFKHQIRLTRLRLTSIKLRWGRIKVVAQRHRLSYQAGTMRHQLSQRDRDVEQVSRSKFRQVTTNRCTSRSSRPSSTSCMAARSVNNLETDPAQWAVNLGRGRNLVLWDRRSRIPEPKRSAGIVDQGNRQMLVTSLLRPPSRSSDPASRRLPRRDRSRPRPDLRLRSVGQLRPARDPYQKTAQSIDIRLEKPPSRFSTRVMRHAGHGSTHTLVGGVQRGHRPSTVYGGLHPPYNRAVATVRGRRPRTPAGCLTVSSFATLKMIAQRPSLVQVS